MAFQFLYIDYYNQVCKSQALAGEWPKARSGFNFTSTFFSLYPTRQLLLIILNVLGQQCFPNKVMTNLRSSAGLPKRSTLCQSTIPISISITWPALHSLGSRRVTACNTVTTTFIHSKLTLADSPALPSASPANMQIPQQHPASQNQTITSLLLKKKRHLDDILVQILLGSKNEYQNLNNFHVLETVPLEMDRRWGRTAAAFTTLNNRWPANVYC